MSLLDVIKIELENMSTESMIEPTTELSEQDNVVGEIGTDLKKLYSLAIQWDKEAIGALVAARYVGKASQCNNLIKKATELRKKSEILLEIFWVSIKDAFELWDKPTIGIRTGWKVVWSEHELDQTLDVIIGEFFKGGEA